MHIIQSRIINITNDEVMGPSLSFDILVNDKPDPDISTFGKEIFMPGYINVLQGKIARFEQSTTPSAVLGFFTDGITSCSFLVFSGKKDGKRRISAFHSDGSLLNTSPESILAESAWVGELESCCLYRDPRFDNDKPHALLAFAAANNITITENNFDAHSGSIELALTFDESVQNGYQFKTFKHNTFPEIVINHPQAEKIYAYYKINISLQEIHSNNVFNDLCKQDPSLFAKWEANQLTFAQRRKMTHRENSALTHNPLIFDGVYFTTPGIHDYKLTPFATEFFLKYKGLDLQANEFKLMQRAIERTGIILSSPLTQGQIGIIKLIQIYDTTVSITNRGPMLEGVINHSGVLINLYQFIENHFNIKMMSDKYIQSLITRYQKTTTFIGSIGIDYFNSKQYENALDYFIIALEHAQLSFMPETREIGSAHHNVGAANYELYMKDLQRDYLNQAKLHLDLAFKIRTQVKDNAAQKTQDRLTKIALESKRISHVIFQAAHLDAKAIKNKQHITGDTAYYFLNPVIPAGEVDLTTQMIELYGRYASRFARQALPVFCKKDYEQSNIRYCAFFVGNCETGRGGITAIALYDNYETPQKNEMKLRFVWQSTLTRDSDSYDRQKKLDSLKAFVSTTLKKYDFAIAQNSAQILEKPYVCPFDTSPIKSTYESLESNGYPFGFDYCIKKCVNPSLLTPAEWQQQERLLDTSGQPLLGNEYECFKLASAQQKSILEVVNQNAFFLKSEQGYDFAYTVTAENAASNDIFVITNPERTLCLGVFTFQREDKGNVHHDLTQYKKACSDKQQEKHLQDQQMFDFLHRKFTNNEKKEHTAYENGGSSTSNYFRTANEHDAAAKKYSEKRAHYQDMLFYWRSKTKIDEKLRLNNTWQYQLQVAWIHPFYRRKGIMQKLWPQFQTRYGAFLIDKPSDMMQSFLDDKKINRAGHGWGQSLLVG